MFIYFFHQTMSLKPEIIPLLSSFLKSGLLRQNIHRINSLLLGVEFDVRCPVTIIIVEMQDIFITPQRSLLPLTTSGLSASFLNPDKHSSDFCPYHFVFSRMSNKNEIMQWVAFCDQLLIPSILCLRVFHVFAYINSLFLFIAELYSVLWMCHNLFIQLPCGFHLAIMAKAASRHLCTSLCGDIFSFFLDKQLTVRLLAHIVNAF